MAVRSALRPLRAAVFAAVCVALTAAGHELAGGHVVGPVALGAGLVAVFAAALTCGRCERSQGAITAGMLAGQVGLHQLFATAEGPAASMASGSADPAMTSHDGAAALAMLTAHLGAAVVAGWWLRRGEASCWRLLRRTESAATAALRAVLAHLAQLVDSPATDRGSVGIRRPVRHSPGDGSTVLLAHSAPRRGPPHPSHAI